MGYDVTAKSTGGRGKLLAGIVEDCFKDIRVYDGTAVSFAQSPEKAAQILKKRFGDNATGVVEIAWKNSFSEDGVGNGHAFSWKIENGIVRFLDFQSGNDDAFIRKQYWKYIDPNGLYSFARLDKDKNGNTPEINMDVIRDYVDAR